NSYAPGAVKPFTEAFAPLATPVIKLTNFNAHSSTEGLRPPDIHGAVGTTHFVQITNSHIDMWTRQNTQVLPLAKSVTLATFFDFPQLGMDQDAVLITANIFNGNTFLGADFFAVAKARLYNGLGFSVPVFTGLVGTLAPPIVRDQNASTFLIAAPPEGTTLSKYRATNTSKTPTTLVGPVNISVPAYTVPPSAHQ